MPQQRINTFADATADHQWIDTDPERARAESPFGGPIAHGYLTPSLAIPMWEELLTVTSVTTAINYGLNKVRLSAYLGSTIEFYDFLLYATAAALVFGPAYVSNLDPAAAAVAS